MLNNQLEDKIEIRKSYAENLTQINGNVGKLHQAILNILTNAIHAIISNGVILIRTLNDQKYITIQISDNGCGISNNIINKIFDPFFTTKNPGKGTGLGLSICYKIIKEHKGELDVFSEENKGTTMNIKLPI